MLSSNDVPFVDPYAQSGLTYISTFVICNETIPWVSRDDTEKFPVLDWILSSENANGEFGLWVPEGCVPVKLLPPVRHLAGCRAGIYYFSRVCAGNALLQKRRCH